MRFPDGWQVDVVRPGNAAHYADIVHGADRYVVGVPGQPFEVRVTAPPQQLQYYPCIKVTMLLDGRSPNISQILSAIHPSGTFKGFINTIKGQHLTNQFLFGKAETDPTAPPCKPGSSQVGGLEIHIEQVQELPGTHTSAVRAFSQSAASFKAVEGESMSSICKSHLPACLPVNSTLGYAHAKAFVCNILEAFFLVQLSLPLKDVLCRQEVVHATLTVSPGWEGDWFPNHVLNEALQHCPTPC